MEPTPVLVGLAARNHAASEAESELLSQAFECSEQSWFVAVSW